MADIQPFAAWHYDPTRVNPADVLTEPYDKISPALQATYYNRSPHNFVRIELGWEEPFDSAQGKAGDKYQRAAESLSAWRKEKILIQHPRPAFYHYEQTFSWADGPAHTRRAILARVRLTPFSEGVVLPHEHTLAKPKADRMSLLRATQVFTGQIFLLYDGQKVQLPSLTGNTIFEYSDEHNIQHRLAAITDNLTPAFANAKLYVADGHHRYETAIAYRDERRGHAPPTPDAPYEYVMAALVDYRDPDLLILPTHRVIKNVSNFDAEKLHERLLEHFQMERHPDLMRLQEHLDRTPNGAHCFGMFLPPNNFWLLRLRQNVDRARFFADKPPLWDNLDVAILHGVILEPLLGIGEEQLRQQTNVDYFRDASDATRKVEKSEAQAAFFLNPTPVESVIAVADARSRMPQKSTDFYPKFPSGLTLYDVSGK